MKHITVLFTAVSGWPTHATVGALRNSKNADYTIVGTDCSPNPASKNYVDYLYKVPRCNDHAYVDALLDICKLHDVDVIVPLISEDLTPLSENREKIEQAGVKILMSGAGSLLDVANDKMKLQDYLESHGVYVMPHSIKLNVDTLDEDLAELGYPDKPVALKLKDGCGGIGFKIIDDKKASGVAGVSSRQARVNPFISKAQVIEYAKSQGERYFLQEYLTGTECGTLCLVDNGRTVYSPTHENYEMQYATTTDCELTDNEEASQIVRKINEMLKLDGNIGYDFKRDSEGHLRLLEINPRISATVSLAVKARLNIVEMGVFHALGLPIDESIVPLYGLRLQRVYGTLYTYKGEPYGS